MASTVSRVPPPIDADAAGCSHRPSEERNGEEFFLYQPFELEGEMAQEGEDVITPLVIRHKDIRGPSPHLLHPFQPDIHLVCKKGCSAPQPGIAMNRPASSIEGIGEQRKETQGDGGNRNTRPNKN